MQNLTEHFTLSIRVHESHYDRVTEWLLAYPHQNLEFAAQPLNLHWQTLNTAQEKVSGFQAGFEFQVDISKTELETLRQHLENKLSEVAHQIRIQTCWL
ncbi:hypothetical protein [Thiomicrorhabdus indica]|uniref:hypothetical protein n=1 Tax=Thiomicrorhabdus indica TaxID=2267253 RepID=UPI002AA88932|nr:hypothetical protein [Thiomicrorhabdus indica]